MGIPYQVIGPATATQENEQSISSDQIEKGVNIWIESLRNALSSQLGQVLINWTDVSSGPYFSAQLSWPAYHALVLSAAYSESPDLATAKPDLDNFQNDPAYLRITDKEFKSIYKQLTRNVELWLPWDISVAFEAPCPTQHVMCMGSVATLVKQLATLNEATWKADANDIEKWRKQGTPSENESLETLAKYCFSVLMESANFCIVNNLPMILDY